MPKSSLSASRQAKARRLFLCLFSMLALLPGLLFPLSTWAQACIIHAASADMEVQVCQQNRSIPPNLFQSGFCKPQLAGQKTTVTFADRCPAGAFGVCRNAQTGGIYQQDIYYYGIESDARFLKPACERQSKGVWLNQ